MPHGTAGKIYVRWPIHMEGKPEHVTVEGDDSFRVDENGIWLSATRFRLVAGWRD
jgi:hypothetical protein